MLFKTLKELDEHIDSKGGDGNTPILTVTEQVLYDAIEKDPRMIGDITVSQHLSTYRDCPLRVIPTIDIKDDEILVTQSEEEFQDFGRICRLEFPNGGKIYVHSKGWSLSTAAGEEVIIPYSEINLAIQKSLELGYKTGK